MTQELNPPAGQEPSIGLLYRNDFEIIEQNPEKTEKTTQKKVKEPKKTTTKKVTNKTSNSKKEILDKLSSIKIYQSPLITIHYSYKYKYNSVIK